MKRRTSMLSGCALVIAATAVACTTTDSGNPGSASGDAGATQAPGVYASQADAAVDSSAGDASVPIDPTVTTSRIGVSASILDFGMGDCGGAAAADQALTLSNTGTKALAWSASLDSLASFTITGATNGTIPPGGTFNLKISPRAIPSTAVAGAIGSGALTIKSDDPAQPTTTVGLGIVAQGATFTLDPVGADFGVVAVGSPSDAAITLRNTGNKAASVAFGAPANDAFAVSWGGSPASTSVAPGASLGGLSAHFSPTNAASLKSSSVLAVTGAVCGASVNSIPLAGQGTTGALVYSPGTLDYGNTPCGTTSARALSFTVGNTGNAPMSWSVGLDNGPTSKYTLSVTGGILLPNTTQVVTVTPNSGIPAVSEITANLYGEHATLTTNTPGDTPHTIDLRQTAYGAILNYTAPATTLDFGTQQAGVAAAPQTFAITNSGNQPSTVSFTNAGSTAFSLPAVTVAPGGVAQNMSVIFKPNAIGAVTSTFNYQSATGTMCKPLPATPSIAVKGTGFDSASAISSRTSGNAVLASSGNVYLWGQMPSWASTPLTPLPNVSAPTIYGYDGSNQFCQVKADQTVNCQWYAGCYYSSANATVSNLDSVTALSIGQSTSYAVKADGSVWYFQNNCGNTLNANQISTTVTGMKTYVTYGNSSYPYWYPNSFQGCGLKSDNTVWCFRPGYNYGELYQQIGTSTATQVVAGNDFFCALNTDQSVSCWGNDGNGQLGNWPTTSQSLATPITVPLTTNDIVAIAAGSSHACAVRATGEVVCWGYNGYGQLGNSATGGGTAPVSVTSTLLTHATAISAGDNHTCAVQQTTNQVYCWGNNGNGQVKLPAGGNFVVPTALPGL